MLARIHGGQLLGQTHVCPNDFIIGITRERMIHQMQELGRLSIIAKIRVNRDRHASLTENPHEVGPASDALYRSRLSIIAQKRLLHHVQLARPRKHARKLGVIKGYLLRCVLRMRQIDEGHR